MLWHGPDEGPTTNPAMHLLTEAIVLAVRAHGEHGAVVRALTPSDGIQPGYVRGGRSRRLRPVLLAGNVVQAEYRARTDEQLAQLSVELVHSRAPLYAEALPAAAIDWSCALTAAALPEGQAYPRLHAALDGVLAAVEAAPSAKGWASALVRYELLILSELGFGLDLSECAATGTTDDLAFVSPKSGRAVSAGAAGAYRDRLLPLPAFIRAGGAGEWDDIFNGLRLTGHFLARDLLIERQSDVLAARQRLLDRLRRVVR
jgi:DNA repair protein RecO (recombination protein O)